MRLRLVFEVINLLIRQPRLWEQQSFKCFELPNQVGGSGLHFPKPANSFIEFRSKTQYGQLNGSDASQRYSCVA